METNNLVQEGYVQIEHHKGVASVTFHHPQGNSLPSGLLHKLAQAFHGLGNEDNVRVILLRSAGGSTFCAGASFDELSAINNSKDGLHFFTGFAHVINAMRKCGKLIVGRIHGRCVGGGVGLAAACDYAIACQPADIKLSELAIGLGPFVVGPAIQRKIGLSAFSQIAIDATMWRNADWARRKGLYAELHETEEGMDESIQRLTNTLNASNPEALAQIKQMLWEGTENWDTLLHHRAGISGHLVTSTFTQEAIAQFNQQKLLKR